MSMMAVFAGNLVSIILLAAAGAPLPHNQHSVFVIVGGTGDLAAKYLWQSVFEVYLSSLDSVDLMEPGGRPKPAVNHSFDFYAAGRSQQDKGNVILSKILTGIKCETDDSESDMGSTSICKQRLTQFIDKVTYVTLHNEDDFILLCSELTNRFHTSPSTAEKELIIFMAIPPNAYETVLYRFYKHCGTIRNNIKIKLALEKPFGLDKASAEMASRNLLLLFTEDEIYRVDHYLGKSVVKTILPFRFVRLSLIGRTTLPFRFINLSLIG